MTVSRPLARFGGLAAVAILVALFVASGWWRHLTAADLRAHYGEIVALVLRQPLLAIAAFTILSAAVTTACLPGTSILVVLGGALFGTLQGGAAALLGAVVGSTCVFLACRAASADWRAAFPDGRVARLVASLSRHAFSTLLVLRLTPVAPLSMVNIAAGFAQLRLAPFVAASVIGSAPPYFIYAAVGAGLRGALSRGAALDTAVLARPAVIGPLLALAALAGVTALANAWRRRRLPTRRA